MSGLRAARRELDSAFRFRRDAEHCIETDRAEIDRVLRTHPHPKPMDLDPVARGALYASRISKRHKLAVAKAGEAAEQAALAHKARSFATRILALVGIRTTEQRQVDCLMDQARCLDSAATVKPSLDEYTEARTYGQALAYAARENVRVWRARPDVARALDDDRLNRVAQKAAWTGDCYVSQALAYGKPVKARVIMRARELHASSLACEHEAEQAYVLNAMRSGPEGPRIS